MLPNENSTVTNNFTDGLVNAFTGLGTSTKDWSLQDRWRAGVGDWRDYENAYNHSWIARKAVDIRVDDMLREPRAFTEEIELGEDLNALYDEFGLDEKIELAMKHRRLYGGAAIYINDGGEPASPLDIENLRRGSLTNFTVLAAPELDPKDPVSDMTSRFYGDPETFEKQRMLQSSLNAEAQREVHRSRLIVLRGESAGIVSNMDQWWGVSILQIVDDALKAAAKSPQIVNALLDKAKIDMIGVKGLANALTNAQAEQQEKKRWREFVYMQSLFNADVYDLDREEISHRQIDFTNLDKIMLVQALFASAAVDVPSTRFLSQSPNGLSATGESDTRNYYDSVRAEQRRKLRPIHRSLDYILQRHAFGRVNDAIAFKYPPLNTLTPLEEAQAAQATAAAVSTIAATALPNDAAMSAAVDMLLTQASWLPGYDANTPDEFDLGEDEPEENGEDKDGKGTDDDQNRRG